VGVPPRPLTKKAASPLLTLPNLHHRAARSEAGASCGAAPAAVKPHPGAASRLWIREFESSRPSHAVGLCGAFIPFIGLASSAVRFNGRVSGSHVLVA
jgi:hypothetical protein